ncbi:hypothetical protein N656DRAFT_720865 [Canariomyces notabilis]|uniref:Thioesterase domain-containing protein n=1 Tax=Canariomyces notabilis TaxID=2074819 RepID=A0AAN6T7F5_9PEZI|nr:hypothetical protein N656DRAFT_720865 [Canariomyces arenarius]
MKTSRSRPEDAGQFIKDPLGHFLAMPWAAALLLDPATTAIVVPDRKPLPSGARSLVNCILNSATTVRACVSYWQSPQLLAQRSAESQLSGATEPASAGGRHGNHVSSRQALLQESGPKIKEDTKTQPCLLFNALLDIGEQMSGFEGTLHGGATALFIDEAMGSVAGGKSPFAAVTVQINTNFRKTINLPQVLLVRARVVKKEGRKIYVRASIENKDGNIMAESDGLFIETDDGRTKL